MWPPLKRPSPSLQTSSSPNPNPSFACSSFKDLPLLFSPSDSSSSSSSPSPPHQLQSLHRHLSAKTIFHRVRLASSLLRHWPSQTLAEPKPEPQPQPEPESLPIIHLPEAEHRIVLYYTSLRIVRRTFDACRSVHSILDAFRVTVDERDVSIYPGFLEELQQILGVGKEKLTLPKVFIGGRYVGGADEIWQLYETGELKKLVEELPPAKPRVCEACTGYRFVLCGDCNGSHKVYSGKGGFRSCSACFEDGLIKCPVCYPTALVSP